MYKNIAKLGCLALLLGCLGFVSAVAKPECRKVTLDQFSVSEQKIGNKTYQVGHVIINAPQEQVWDVLTDYDNAVQNFSYLKKCQKLEDKGLVEIVKFTAKTGIGPLTVDYVLELKESQPTLLEWRRVSGAFKAYEGYWKLAPADNGRQTMVTYAKHVDAGFFFSKFFVARMVKESIPVIFNELRTVAEREQIGSYAKKSLSTKI